MTDEPKESSSPVCLAREADDSYMGFASKAEIAAFMAGLETAHPDAIRRMLPRIRDDALYKLLSEKLPRQP